ncbi:hypothetical protein [Caballeronia sp. GAFFF2]|uniref:hypothetical protein n=1 Tax=Caballeronia sp. GAFFF2 TaxID=2921741 RepID=UPI0020298419|nr:hypothetical protein [Caballeronia sp. GAFFF2]
MAIRAARHLLGHLRFIVQATTSNHYKKSRGVVMFLSFFHSLIESNALWLIWAAVGVVFLGLCIVFASVLLGETDEPLYRAAPRDSDSGKMIV